jgi:anti-sigma regulatory factor (Ser/Thr protein kinase)
VQKRWPLKRGDFKTVGWCRKEFRRCLADHAAADTVAHELIFGELVTNAVRYGQDPMWAGLTVSHGVVRIVVQSSGPGFDLEECLGRPPTADGGRGLQIVQTLADTVAVMRSQGDTCHVTATLRL